MKVRIVMTIYGTSDVSLRNHRSGRIQGWHNAGFNEKRFKAICLEAFVVPPGIEPGTQGFSVLIEYPCKWLSSSSKPQKSSLLVETFRKTTGLFPCLFTLVYLLLFINSVMWQKRLFSVFNSAHIYNVSSFFLLLNVVTSPI